MIFVDRSQELQAALLAQAALLVKDRDGLTEREKATRFYANEANHEKTFPFKKYKEGAVNEALNLLFHGKCAYCESITAATQPIDVEHFRPKGGYNVTEGRRIVLKLRGYYWLAAEWDNLLPSCIDCNRERIQVQLDNTRKKTGKGNNFPLENESMRATNPGEEAREVPLLLNPCIERPEEHLEFIDEGNIRARLVALGEESRKGQVSIEVYGLRRLGLVLARKARATLILAQMKRVKNLVLKVQQSPTNTNYQNDLRDEMKDLKRFMRDDQPYAGMARQMIAAFIESLRTP